MFSDLDNVTSWRLMLGSEIVSHLEGKDDLSGIGMLRIWSYIIKDQAAGYGGGGMGFQGYGNGGFGGGFNGNQGYGGYGQVYS